MSYDFSLLTHIQLKKKKSRHQGHWCSSRACTSLKQEKRSSIAFPPCFSTNSTGLLLWLQRKSEKCESPCDLARPQSLGVGSEVSGYCLISSRFGLIKISHPLMHGTQNNPNHLHHSWFLTINQTASLKSSGSWGFAAGIKSLLTVWQAWP